MSDLGEMIRARRKQRGLTATAFALKVGASRATVNDWERGLVTPSSTNCERIARALDLDPAYVAEMAGHQTAPTGDDTELRERAEQFKAGLRGIPRVFWAAATDASIRLASLYPEAMNPVTSAEEPAITEPEQAGNRAVEAVETQEPFWKQGHPVRQPRQRFGFVTPLPVG